MSNLPRYQDFSKKNLCICSLDVHSLRLLLSINRHLCCNPIHSHPMQNRKPFRSSVHAVDNTGCWDQTQVAVCKVSALLTILSLPLASSVSLMNSALCSRGYGSHMCGLSNSMYLILFWETSGAHSLFQQGYSCLGAPQQCRSRIPGCHFRSPWHWHDSEQNCLLRSQRSQHCILSLPYCLGYQMGVARCRSCASAHSVLTDLASVRSGNNNEKVSAQA